MFNVKDPGSRSETVPVLTDSFALAACNILLQKQSSTDTHIKFLNCTIVLPVAISFVPEFGEGVK